MELSPSTSYMISLLLFIISICIFCMQEKEGFNPMPLNVSREQNRASIRGGRAAGGGGGRSMGAGSGGSRRGRNTRGGSGGNRKRGGINIKINNNNRNNNGGYVDDYYGARGWYYNDRPYRYWSNFINPVPTYYPSWYYDRYDYTNNIVPSPGDVCFARISISDAFGPYTAGVMGKQAWLDWAGRNGFDKVFLDRSSVTNSEAIVSYVGDCPGAAQNPPNTRRWQPFNATPQDY